MTITEHTHANLPLTHVRSLDIVNGPVSIESRELYTDVLSEFAQVGTTSVPVGSKFCPHLATDSLPTSHTPVAEIPVLLTMLGLHADT